MPWNLEAAAGAPGASLLWRGTWSSALSYNPNDAVSYLGSSYVSKTNNTNKDPTTSPADWDVLSAGGPAMPVGSITDYGGSAAPTGWLICDGSSKSRTTFAALFGVIGTTYGAPDSSNFYLPDFRGRTSIGVGQGTSLTNRLLAAVGGEESHILTVAELASHGHSANNPNHTHPLPSMGLGNCAGGGFGCWYNQPSTNTGGAGAGVTINNSGSDGAHNTMQPFLAVNKIIKT
jgi:microcystin-dependent protein